jgi:hypothetical protein
MGQTYRFIDDSIRQWMGAQKMFFIGTAPLADDGQVNLSPKGHDSLRILDEKTLAYFDFGGSGVETIAHVRENGRIVVMMCAFDGPPKIFRFHGTGEVIAPPDAGFDELHNLFDMPGIGVRAIIRVHLNRISDSCGYGVPTYDFKDQRRSAQNYIEKTGTEAIREDQIACNLQSIDGLPGITEAEARAYVGAEERK